MSSTVTGADFRAIRTLLNLSQASCASVLGITRETVARYEGEKRPVNPEVYWRLLDLLDRVEDYADRALNMIEDDTTLAILIYSNDKDFSDYQPDISADLKSHHVHFAMVSRIKQTLDSQVNLVTFKKNQYKDWLQKKKMTDTEDARTTWASLQL